MNKSPITKRLIQIFSSFKSRPKPDTNIQIQQFNAPNFSKTLHWFSPATNELTNRNFTDKTLTTQSHKGQNIALILRNSTAKFTPIALFSIISYCRYYGCFIYKFVEKCLGISPLEQKISTNYSNFIHNSDRLQTKDCHHFSSVNTSSSENKNNFSMKNDNINLGLWRSKFSKIKRNGNIWNIGLNERYFSGCKRSDDDKEDEGLLTCKKKKKDEEKVVEEKPNECLKNENVTEDESTKSAKTESPQKKEPESKPPEKPECDEKEIKKCKTLLNSKPLCIKVKPKNNLPRLREPPAWKVWLYSLFGVKLRKRKLGRCCNRLIDVEEESKKVRPKEVLNFPTPTLEPSLRHYERTESERTQICRFPPIPPVEVVDRCPKEQDIEIEMEMKEEPPKDEEKETKEKETKKKEKEKGKEKEKEKEDEEEIKQGDGAGMVETIQKSTTDMCKSLLDLCVSKTKKPKTDPCKKPDKKKKPPCNALEPTGYKPEPLKMPTRYFCGATDIENKIKMITRNRPYETKYKYQDICKRKPGEEKPDC